MSYNSSKDQRKIILWLSSVCSLIILMILIGGFTRLTDSGLSITEWKPVSGVLMPITDNAWQLEFEKYKQSPEFININYAMKLSEFKYIYMVEFVHRIAARITGIVLVLPFIYFLWKGLIRGRDALIYTGAIILLLFQGFVGWYMVKSGLVSNPHVSHFRLALHLLMAVFLYSILIWQIFKNTNQFVLISVQKSAQNALCWGKIVIICVLVQITLGAFVAGLKAGLIYNDFPLMGKKFIPYELEQIKFSLRLFSDPACIQFFHRIMAYLLTVVVIVFGIKIIRLKSLKLTKSSMLMLLVLALQITSGIFTLTHAVPIVMALIHQLGAILLLSCCLWCCYLLSTDKK